jgi:amino acid adenylation domain-containing protein
MMQNATVYERFKSAADRSPNACAIDTGDRQLSYAELERIVASIIARLAACAGPARGIVAILAEDRILAIAAMLGVAGSGHAYVSLDPSDPEERLRFILDDSDPFALLVDPALADHAANLARDRLAILRLDDTPDQAWTASAGRPVAPDDLLYLFYTSGSTGHPKGVRQSHRNLLFFVDAYARTLAIETVDRLSLLYTLSFSAANMDIYGALLNGATLCTYDMRCNGVPGLADWLYRTRITVLHAVPTVFRELAHALDPECRFPEIRAVDLGGETLFAEDVSRFRCHVAPDCRIVNHLAATEASVIAQFVVPAELDGMSGALPAGHSPAGVEVRIVRADGSAADVDESGFILIDSPHVSPGYWRRPDLEAEAFSDLPGRPGWRRYRGGDLGRIDSAGNLHFIGRDSTRIKLRGLSVDLTEIEAALLACDGVRNAAVVPRSAPGQEVGRLIACVVMSPSARRDPVRLRRQLVGKLPHYMLPGGYAFLKDLPTAATGKLDRRALSALDLDQALYRPDYEEPVDALEREVAGLFSRVLKYAPVGRLDDFFLLGGDSLSLVELQLLARERFGQDLPALIDDAMVTGIAARLRKQQATEGGALSRLVPLRTTGSAPALFLVHGRLGQAYVSPHFASLLGDDQPLYAIQARGLDGLEPPHETVQAMALDYVDAVVEHQPDGPYFIGALCAGGYVAMEMARLLRARGAEVLPVLLFDPPAPRFRLFPKRFKERQYLKRLQRRKDGGRINVNLDDSRYAAAAVRVAHAFELAIGRLQWEPYQGDVFILASRQRLTPRFWGDPAKRRKIFAAAPTWLPVGDSHGDVLDPHNEEFARHLAWCMRMIRAGESRPDIPREAVFDEQQDDSGRSGRWRGIRRVFGL